MSTDVHRLPTWWRVGLGNRVSRSRVYVRVTVSPTLTWPCPYP